MPMLTQDLPCRNEIRDRDRKEDRIMKAPMLRQASQPESTMLSKDRDIDIKVLMSQNKGKKVNRKTIIEEGTTSPFHHNPPKTLPLTNPTAQLHRQEFFQRCADSPIVAIETKDEVFEGINDTRLSDPDSWKRFIQNAAPGERQYLGQLQTMLKGMARESAGGNGNAIVYNFRTKACVLYYLGRGVG
jgi:translation initiation factor 2-alpha kinase 4